MVKPRQIDPRKILWHLPQFVAFGMLSDISYDEAIVIYRVIARMMEHIRDTNNPDAVDAETAKKYLDEELAKYMN